MRQLRPTPGPSGDDGPGGIQSVSSVGWWIWCPGVIVGDGVAGLLGSPDAGPSTSRHGDRGRCGDDCPSPWVLTDS